MAPKVANALKLIQQNDAQMFQGLCFLMEVAEESPQDLDPVALALVNKIVRPVVRKTEQALGVKEEF
jgi:hypothetical protein